MVIVRLVSSVSCAADMLSSTRTRASANARQLPVDASVDSVKRLFFLIWKACGREDHHIVIELTHTPSDAHVLL